jgi:hypothetical protein
MANAGTYNHTKEHFAEGSAAATPDASEVVIYAKADGLMYSKDDAGTETLMSSGVAAGGGTHSTLGTTSTGASFRTPNNAGITYLKKITVAADAFLMSVNVYIKGNNANAGALGAAVWSDSAGAPVNVIAGARTIGNDGVSAALNGNIQLNATARWIKMPLGIWLAAADYWLGVKISGGTADNALLIAYSAGTGSDKTQAHSSRDIDISIVGTSNTTDDHSIYADVLTL